MSPDDAYALKNSAEVKRRLTLLNEPYMSPLTELVHDIRERHPKYQVPYHDPCDAGVKAQILILLEAPGPKAVTTQFVSINNPDQTAKNLGILLADAGIDRREVLVWNVVPWYVGDGKRIRPVNRRDLAEAALYLDKLLGLLPRLRYAVLMGLKAQRATQLEGREDLNIIKTYHPSPQVFNISKEKKAETRAAFERLGERLKRA